MHRLGIPYLASLLWDKRGGKIFGYGVAGVVAFFTLTRKNKYEENRLENVQTPLATVFSKDAWYAGGAFKIDPSALQIVEAAAEHLPSKDALLATGKAKGLLRIGGVGFLDTPEGDMRKTTEGILQNDWGLTLNEPCRCPDLPEAASGECASCHHRIDSNYQGLPAIPFSTPEGAEWVAVMVPHTLVKPLKHPVAEAPRPPTTPSNKTAKGVLCLVHGGFWDMKQMYDASPTLKGKLESDDSFAGFVRADTLFKMSMCVHKHGINHVRITAEDGVQCLRKQIPDAPLVEGNEGRGAPRGSVVHRASQYY